MHHAPDAKLQLLAATDLCRGWTEAQVLELARLADLVDVPAGSVLQHQGRNEPWTYHVLDGSALVVDDELTTVVRSGAWLPGEADVTTTVVDELVALVFRADDLRDAAASLPFVVEAGRPVAPPRPRRETVDSHADASLDPAGVA